MKTAYAIRHLAFEDLGIFDALLKTRGFSIHYLEAGIDNLSQAREADLLIVLGGPIGANDEHDYPFILDELTLLRERFDKHQPTLGICLGAQLMARALGARVYPGTAKELGWQALTLTEQGKHSCARHFDGTLTSMLHWHGDTFDLPENSVLLASTAICAQQIVAFSSTTLGFQCHPEVNPAKLEQWFIGHTAEITATGTSLKTLRADTQIEGEKLIRQSTLFFNEWLNELGL